MNPDQDELTGDDDFDAAFQEAAGMSTPEKAESSDADGQGVAADDADEGDEPNEPKAASKPEPKAPVAEDKQPAKDKQAEPGSEVATLRAQLAEALHRERSASNRISARDQQANELKRKVEELTAQLQQLQNQQTQAAKPAGGAQAVDDILSDSPDLRAAIERRISEATEPLRAALDDANSRLAEVGQQAATASEAVQPLTQDRAQQRIVSVQQQLDATFGQIWRADVQSPEFQAWLNTKSRAVQDIFAGSVDFGETSDVLAMFYARPGAAPLQQPASQPTTQPDQQQRLRAAAGIRPGAARRVSSEPDKDDFDSAFDFAAAQARKNGNRHDHLR